MTIVRTSLHTVESARRERFEPAGNIASTNVQKAIQELDSEKVAVTDITAWTTVAGATYTVLPSDRNLWVTANPCTITWPLSATITYEVLVKDGNGGANANNIHNVPSGAETIDGSTDRKITTNRGWLRIKPNPTGNGYTLVG